MKMPVEDILYWILDKKEVTGHDFYRLHHFNQYINKFTDELVKIKECNPLVLEAVRERIRKNQLNGTSMYVNHLQQIYNESCRSETADYCEILKECFGEFILYDNQKRYGEKRNDTRTTKKTY